MDTRLGWTDLTLKADGEMICLEVEVRGTYKVEWHGEPRVVRVTQVLVHGETPVNILPVLTPAQVRLLAKEVEPQARLRAAGHLEAA